MKNDLGVMMTRKGASNLLSTWILPLLLFSTLVGLSSSLAVFKPRCSINKKKNSMNRKRMLKFLSSAGLLSTSTMLLLPQQARSFAFVQQQQQQSSSTSSSSPTTKMTGNTNDQVNTVVAYKSMSVAVNDGGGGTSVDVPVACWFPATTSQQQQQSSSSTKNAACWFPGSSSQSSTKNAAVTYQHRISVRKIGQLLAGWDFIPGFVSRDFNLQPTVLSSSSSSSSKTGRIINGEDTPLPKQAPVVLLAHGYLGSRFDLSHLAEELAAEGFACFAPEYPESLAASYDGLDRQRITNALLRTIDTEATGYGIIGHSLGCGTAIETGDDDWSRVCIAGFPKLRDGRPLPGKNILFLSSMNDGAVSLNKVGGIRAIPSDFTVMDEASFAPAGSNADGGGGGRTSSSSSLLPDRTAVVFDRPDAPNHISFLAGSVGDAMVDFLSPLLPVAQAASIPLLDFDRYQISRDSDNTAKVVHPIIIQYLKQRMMLER